MGTHFGTYKVTGQVRPLLSPHQCVEQISACQKKELKTIVYLHLAHPVEKLFVKKREKKNIQAKDEGHS